MALFKKKDDKALAVVAEPPKNLITQETVADYLRTFGVAKGLTDNEAEMFTIMAVEMQLNPFKKELYPIPYEAKDGTRTFSLVTGYEVYLRRAERSPHMDWWKCDIILEGENTRAIVIIKRKDRPEPFEWPVWMNEACGFGPLWRKMPKFMLRKVAIAQAFRLYFPEDFEGMPYIEEEMNERDVSPVDKSDMPRAVDTPESVAEVKTEARVVERVVPGEAPADPPKPVVTPEPPPREEARPEAKPSPPDPTPEVPNPVTRQELITYINTHGNIPVIEKAKFMGQIGTYEKEAKTGSMTPLELSAKYAKAINLLKETYGE